MASDEPLPPFGVRGLYPAEKPFSLLQLSERQYNESLDSFPEAVLTWLDDDDGETVTVGSGTELRERLRDPVPRSNPRVQFRNADTQRDEDRLVHLFDISQSQTGLSVWRQHEAYFSKTQESLQGFADYESTTASKAEPTSHTDKPLSQWAEEGRVAMSAVPAKTPTRTAQTSGQQTVPQLVGGLGLHLDHLAGFLQSTSDTLRRVAEKSKESGTSPIEEVLAGMTTIIGEVGAFGLDVLDKLGESKPASASDLPTPGRASTIATSTADNDSVVQPNDAALSEAYDAQHSITEAPIVLKPLSIAPEHARAQRGPSEKQDRRGFQLDKNHRMALLNEELAHLHKLTMLNRRDFAQTRARNFGAREKEGPAHQTAEIGRSVARQNCMKSLTESRSKLDKYDLFSCRPLQDEPDKPTSTADTPLAATQEPILDQDAEAIDAAFSARYPPLMTLRKAKTFSALREPHQEPFLAADDVSIQFKRFSRPHPQVFDAETQRRKEYAKTCFPSQQYTPGPGPTDGIIAIPKTVACVSVEEVQAPSFEESTTTMQPMEGVGTAVFTNTEEIQPRLSIKTDAQSNEAISPIEPLAPVVHEQTLPGAWPLPAIGDSVAEASSSMEESSGAFFHRMVKASNSGNAPVSFAHSVSYPKLHRHRSLINPNTRSRPHHDLDRSQTVKHVDSAARLNGPFRELFPPPLAPQSFDDRSEQTNKRAVGPVRKVNRGFSDRRPRSLYENNAHRNFEPVWEDHLQPQKEAAPSSGAVIVDAVNLGPETTEHDIKLMLADDCRTETGSSALISCRIVSTVPVVTAKLVIKNKTHADRIISRLNGKLEQGRLLHFEYAQTGIDAHINRIRGVLPPVTEDHTVRHLRSVPNLHNAAADTTSKPTFAESQLPPRPSLRRDEFGRLIQKHISTAAVASRTTPDPHLVLATVTRITECEEKLKSMGYGMSDATLWSRLRDYAAAADGDVDMALDLIEEDKKVSMADDLEKTIEKSREEFLRDDVSNDTEPVVVHDEDLERAIKRSMEEM